MSSTDRAAEREVRRFFAEHITPAADRLRQRGACFFATGPDAGAETYYEKHEKADSPFVEIELDDCQSSLAQMWQRQGYPELVELSGPLFALAGQLTPPEEESGDVSPFIYVMF